MGESEKAVYEYIRLANQGKGIVDNVTLKGKWITVSNETDEFNSDVCIEVIRAVDALRITIHNDKIITHVRNAVFWTNYCKCQLNNGKLVIDTDTGCQISIFP